MISIVIPVYNEEENVVLLYNKIVSVMEKMKDNYEIIFSDNASTDSTLKKLKTLPRVKILLLSRNFGQTSNLDAAIHEAIGDIIVTMDGDLQNDPEDIPKLVEKINEGYDVVSGWRIERNDSFSRRSLSRSANWLASIVTGLKLKDSACAIKAYKSEVLSDIHLYGEMHVFLPAYLYMRGAKVCEIPVKHHSRKHGFSKHNFMKAVKDISDLLTIRFLSSMNGRPLVFFGGVGVVSMFLGFIIFAISVYLKLASIRNFGQTPLPILAIFFVLSSIIFILLGFLAELMLRIYFETSNKKPYSIRERIIIGK
ncbi:MAG: glycosyltransferase family 2 protein [Minisyncoccia bacterium]